MKRIRLFVSCVALVLILAACGAAEPQPGVILSGTISTDNAETAEIFLQVSDDGQMITMVRAHFVKINCNGYRGGEATLEHTNVGASIEAGKFEFEASFGQVSGQFTSPTAVKGTIHLTFNNGKTECGIWDWSATDQGTSSWPTRPSP